MEASLPKKDTVSTGPVSLRIAARSGSAGVVPGPDTAAGTDRLRELELENRQLQLTVRRLRQLAFIDGLTGLANRRHFNLALRSEIRRARRVGAPLALMLCDVDHFKRVNDSFGHQAGDDVLRVLAEQLNRACRRGGDIAARYGGEEFSLLLPGVDAAEAPAIAARLCRGIAARAITCGQPARALRVTVSFGVSVLASGVSCSPRRLVSAADTALYHAKNSGRNCVRFLAVEGEPD